MLRAKQNRVTAAVFTNSVVNNPISGQKIQGWEVGSSQVSAIGIPAHLVRKIGNKTNTKHYEKLQGGTNVLADSRCLVVQQNTLSGVGRYRSQFNTDAASRSRSGIKSVKYYVGDENEDGVLDYVNSDCKRCMEPIAFCDAPPCAGPCSVQDPGTMLMWFSDLETNVPDTAQKFDVWVRFGTNNSAFINPITGLTYIQISFLLNSAVKSLAVGVRVDVICRRRARHH